MEERNEAIVLKATDFKEREKIVTLFSKHEGLISLIIKNISKKNSTLLALASPFTQGEYLYRKGNSNLYLFLDGSLLEEHLYLRDNWGSLEAAGLLVRSLLQSQLPGKASPRLYRLLSTCLKQLPHMKQPALMSAFFQIKLLEHEGLLDPAAPGFDLTTIKKFSVLHELVISDPRLSQIQNYCEQKLHHY